MRKPELSIATSILDIAIAACRDQACGSAFEVDKPYLPACPSCGSTLLRMQTGRELGVVEIEDD